MVALAGAVALLACRAALLPAWREAESAPLGARRACSAAHFTARRYRPLGLPARAALTVLLAVSDVPVFEQASHVLFHATRFERALLGGW